MLNVLFLFFKCYLFVCRLYHYHIPMFSSSICTMPQHHVAGPNPSILRPMHAVIAGPECHRVRLLQANTHGNSPILGRRLQTRGRSFFIPHGQILRIHRKTSRGEIPWTIMCPMEDPKTHISRLFRISSDRDR